jgi:hypothetical protein
VIRRLDAVVAAESSPGDDQELLFITRLLQLGAATKAQLRARRCLAPARSDWRHSMLGRPAFGRATFQGHVSCQPHLLHHGLAGGVDSTVNPVLRFGLPEPDSEIVHTFYPLLAGSIMEAQMRSDDEGDTGSGALPLT